MLDQREKTFVLTPFVVAYPNRGTKTGNDPKSHRPGTHLNKEEATREVLNRIVARVKKI